MTYWEHPKPVQRLRAVDIQDLARASVRLLDAGGLKALTLRAVAQDIGVAPASLYSRVESVDDLYDLALDIALADDAQMAVATREAELPLLMQCFFTHLTTHRWAGQVIGMRALGAQRIWPCPSGCACYWTAQEWPIRSGPPISCPMW